MNRLKELRQTFDISQKAFAKRMQMSCNAVSQIENNIIALNRNQAAEIAKQFKVETDWLLGASRVPVRRTIKPYVPPERPKIYIDDSYVWRR